MLKTSHLRALYGFLSRSMTTMINSRGSLQDHLQNLPAGTELTTHDWKALKSQYDLPLAKFGITSLALMRERSIPSSRSLISFLQSENSLTVYVKCYFFGTLKSHKDFCTPEDHKFIESTLNEIYEKQSQLVSQDMALMIIDGISVTPSWKDHLLKFLDFAKSKGLIWTSLCAKAASAAFMRKDPHLGFQMLEETVSLSTTPPKLITYHEALISALQYIRDLDDSKTVETLLWKLLPFVDQYGCRPRLNFAWPFAQCIETRVENWVARFTEIDESGECACCHRRLSVPCLTDDEFFTLKTKVLENVLVGRDIFVRSTPQEVKRFQNYLKRCGQYTIVIDGLNVFYQVRDKKLKQLIDILEAKGEIVLVLGRKHLYKLPLLRELFKTVKHFLTDDESHDDSFLLYAALSQGQGTYVLSNDFMGGHRDKIDGFVDVRYLFHKWQEQTQVLVNYNTSEVLFPAYTFAYQTSKDGSAVHLPYSTGGSSFIYEESDSKTWLCLQNIGKEKKEVFVKAFPLKKPEAYTASTRRQVNSRYIIEDEKRRKNKFTLINYPGKRMKRA